MITPILRTIFKFLGADLRKVSECNHRRAGNGHAFALLRPSKTHHVFLCTECGLVEREVYIPGTAPDRTESTKDLN